MFKYSEYNPANHSGWFKIDYLAILIALPIIVALHVVTVTYLFWGISLLALYFAGVLDNRANAIGHALLERNKVIEGLADEFTDAVALAQKYADIATLAVGLNNEKAKVL